MAVDLVSFDELRLDEVGADGSMDFDAWIALILDVEKRFPDDIDKLCLIYDSFLSEYPLCYGYWRKYADHKARLCTLDEVVEVFERAVELAAYSVHVWVEYCSFGISYFEDPLDIRRLFRRGLSFVGKDYICYILWDKYIEYEFSQQNWSSLGHIYIQTLTFPTKKLHQYYDSFKKLVSIWEAELGCQGKSSEKVHSKAETDPEAAVLDVDEICHVINNLLDPSTRSEALAKYLSVGEHLYLRACHLNAEIHFFEKNIHRPYFHVKPVDDHQLENWHQYLDFVEKNGDFDWAVKLYERCLIPCANYPEFWMRYVDFVESKGGREIANDALERATQIYLKSVPAVHLFNASFKEQIGEIDGARAAFLHCDTDYESYFIENVMRKANMEKRMGNYVAASDIYKEALQVAAERKSHTLPILYIHYSRLQYMMTNSVDATRDILLDGIHHVRHCKLLLEELIKFAMMHEGARQVSIVDSVIADALSPRLDLSPGLSTTDREDLSRLFLEYVDLHGTIHHLRRAWYRHMKLFPHWFRANSYKQPARDGAILKTKTDAKKDVAQSLGDANSNDLIELPIQVEKLSLASNLDQFGQAINDQSEVANATPSTLELVHSVVAKKSMDDACRPIDESDEPLNRAANDVDSVQAEKPFESNSFQQQPLERESEQELQSCKMDSLSLNARDANSNPSPSRSEVPQEPSISNGIIPENDCNVDVIPSVSSPFGCQANNSAQRFDRCPSTTPSHHSSISTPEHSQLPRPSEIGQNLHSHNISGRGPLDFDSPVHLEDQMDREWLFSSQKDSPIEHSEGQRCHGSSASPSRQALHWHPDDRQNTSHRLEDKQHSAPSRSPRHFLPNEMGAQSHMTKRHHRPSRYQDSSRFQRRAQRQNLNVGQARQMQNAHNQNSASVTQFHLPVQPVAYPQAPFQMPSNEQYAYAQNDQAYAQMFQYYYFQQQQQFLLQHQQSYSMPQPHQQQQQLMQPHQQQQPMQPHQQLQFLQLQYQQQLQLQLQQLQGLYQQPHQQQPPPDQLLQSQHRQLLSYQQLQQLYQQLQLLQQQQQSDQQTLMLQQQEQPQPTMPQLQQQQEQQQETLQQQQEQQQELLQQQQQQYDQLQQQQYLLYLQQQQSLLHQLQQQQQLLPHPQGLEEDQESIHQQILQQLPLKIQQQEQEEMQQQPQQHSPWQHKDQETQAREDDDLSHVDSGSNTHYLLGQRVTHPCSPNASDSAALPQSRHRSPQIDIDAGTD